MNNEIFFARSPLTGKFIRTDINPLSLNLILVRADGKVFCVNHNKWEEPKSLDKGTKIGAGKVCFDCDRVEKGIIIDFKETAKKFLFKGDFYHRYYSDNEIENRKHLLEKDGTLCDIYGYRIRINESENRPFLIEYNMVDRKKIDEVEVFKRPVTIIPRVNPQKCYTSYESPFKYHVPFFFTERLPENVENYAINLYWNKIQEKLNLQRKNIITPNIYGYKDPLDALVRYPSDPGLIKIDTTITKNLILTNEKNAYYKVCDSLEIKSWKKLRNEFDENPEKLILCKNVMTCGFTDINIINEILEYKYAFRIFCMRSYRNDSYNLITDYYLADEYFRWAITCHSQRSVWNTIKKNIETYILPDGDDSYVSDFIDAAQMFVRNVVQLDGEVIDSIRKDGLTKYNHDVLANFISTMNDRNVEFEYTDEQEELQDTISNYDFILPKDSHTLKNIGCELHNCVGTYKDAVIAKSSTIVYVKKYEQKVMCIEVRGKRVIQCRADRNSNPKGEMAQIFNIWYKKHGLVFDGNRW